MSFTYRFMKDVGAPALMWLQNQQKRRRPKKDESRVVLPLRSSQRLKHIMSRHYYLARFAAGARPIAWVSSGAPVELLRAFDFYTIYPENHGALCGARRLGPDLCTYAEREGYSPDLCSYARIDLGYVLSGKTPVGRLPRPDVLFCSTNICQTILHWFKTLSHYWQIPLVLFDPPYCFEGITDDWVAYTREQVAEIVPVLEQIAGESFSLSRCEKTVAVARETALLWGRILDTMKHRPAPMTSFDAFVHMAPVVTLRGLPVALNYYQELLHELEQRVALEIGAVKPERKRLLWDNIAIWHTLREWPNLFAKRGYAFVAATYTHAWAESIHHLDEQHPLESLAMAYGPIFLNNNLEHRLTLMERLIEEYRIDGVLLHSDRSCKPYSIGQYELKRRLSARLGVKTVIIESDMSDHRLHSEEHAQRHLEAFFDALEN
jgi:bcr-type benzoyl-CoA reductase subunit B